MIHYSVGVTGKRSQKGHLICREWYGSGDVKRDELAVFASVGTAQHVAYLLNQAAKESGKYGEFVDRIAVDRALQSLAA